MNVTRLILSSIFLSFLLIVSCARSRNAATHSGPYDCSGRVGEAAEALKRGRHGEVIKILDEVKYQCGGDPVMDSAHYLKGMAYFSQKQYFDARAEFEYLSREYPFSPFAGEALFRIAQIVHNQSRPFDRDQAQTNEAIRLFNDFLDRYPQSEHVDSAQSYLDKAVEKLAAKEYNTARFYRRQSKNDAALIYYRSLIVRFPHSEYRVKGIVDMAEIFVDDGRGEEALEVLNELEKAQLDETLERRVELLYSRIETEQ